MAVAAPQIDWLTRFRAMREHNQRGGEVPAISTPFHVRGCQMEDVWSASSLYPSTVLGNCGKEKYWYGPPECTSEWDEGLKILLANTCIKLRPHLAL